jgi:PAS domain S-box-containing protein
MKANSLTQHISAENLLQHMPVATFVLNARHQVVIWNKACEQLTGLKADEMIGTDQHWRGFYTEKRPCLADLLLDSTLSLYEQASEFSACSEIYHTENWCLMPDGRRLYLVIDAGAISNEQGEVVATVETQRDRTEQRLTMQALTESEQRISSILGSAMDAIVTVDQQHYVKLLNMAAARIFRCAADFAIGQQIDRFIARVARSFSSNSSLSIMSTPKPRPGLRKALAPAAQTARNSRSKPLFRR